MPRPKGIKTKQLNSLERRRIRILYFDGSCTKRQIREITGYTEKQIERATRASSPTPGIHSGRPISITYSQQEELIKFVMASQENRLMSFLQLSMRLFDGQFGQYIIKRTLYRHGFRRRIARRKPPISEKNRLLRLEFAQRYRDWPIEDWGRILWTDETWVTGGKHRRAFVTRRPGEEWEPTCVIEKHQRKRGWMFWGSFNSSGKGPCLFWEKDWGSINTQGYRERILPLIDGWIRLRACNGEHLTLMQDGASSHSSRETRDDLAERRIQVLSWPPYSPDLNPIENCWNWMKDYIEDNWGLEENPSYDQVRERVNEAWHALPNSYLWQQLETMPQRLNAVIEANGLHTKY